MKRENTEPEQEAKITVSWWKKEKQEGGRKRAGGREIE